MTRGKVPCLMVCLGICLVTGSVSALWAGQDAPLSEVKWFKLPPAPDQENQAAPLPKGKNEAAAAAVLRDRSQSWITRLSALGKLGRSRDPGVLPLLLEALEDDSVFIRCNAAEILATRQKPEVKAALEKALNDPGVLVFNGKEVKAVSQAAKWALGRMENPALPRPDNLCSGSSQASNDIAGDIRILEDPQKSGAERAMAASQLGWTMNPEKAAPALMARLSDSEAMVRAAAAQALGILGFQPAGPELIRLMKTDKDWTVRKGAALGISRLKPPGWFEELVRALTTDDTVLVRMAVAERLGEMGDKRAIGPLKAALSDSGILTHYDADGNQRVYRGVAEKAARALEKLGQKVEKTDFDVDWAAEAIQTLATSSDQKKRARAVKSLGNMKPPEKALPHIITAAKNDLSPRVRRAAAFALGKIKGPSALPVLLEMLASDPDKWVRFSAAQVLAEFPRPASVAALKKAAAEDDFFQVRERAKKSLKAMGGAVSKAPDSAGEAKTPQKAAAAVEIISVSIRNNGFKPIGMKLRIGGRQTIPLYQAPPFDLKKADGPDNEPRLYGKLQLGTAQNPVYGFYFTKVDREHPVFHFDANQNGDFTDDGPPVPGRGKHPFGASVYIPFNRLLPGLGLKGKYRTWIWALKKAWDKRQVNRYSYTQLQGKVEINGKTYTAIIPDSGEHDADYTNDGIGVDINGDGKILWKTEYARPGKSLEIDGNAYEFRVKW